jgi:DNA invertase Pin-like site-specific DNA recombinase
MTDFIEAYLRASTAEPDAQRSRGTLDHFASERSVIICIYYADNGARAYVSRPELFHVLADSRPHDILLVEDVEIAKGLRDSQVPLFLAELSTTFFYALAN